MPHSRSPFQISEKTRFFHSIGSWYPKQTSFERMEMVKQTFQTSKELESSMKQSFITMDVSGSRIHICVDPQNSFAFQTQIAIRILGVRFQRQPRAFCQRGTDCTSSICGLDMRCAEFLFERYLWLVNLPHAGPPSERRI